MWFTNLRSLMLFGLVFLLLGQGSIVAQDQDIPEAIANLIDDNKLTKLRYAKDSLGRISKTSENDGCLRVISEAYIANAYQLSISVPLNKRNIKKNQKLLLSFKAKTVTSSLETGEARVLWQLNVSSSPKDRIRKVLSLSDEWETYYIPFTASKFIGKKNLQLAMQFGFPPQEFLIKDVALHLFDKKVSVDQLPKTMIKYEGMEADALWRKDAFDRIEKIRKGNITFQLTKSGQPVKDIPITIRMIDHHFDWGAALRVKSTIDNEKTQAQFAALFNIAVLENDLKFKHWNNTTPEEDVLNTIDQLANRNVKTKGHVLIWPGYRHLPASIKRYKDNPDKIKETIDNHLTDILSKTNGKVDRWDVVNEAYTNKDLQKLTGSEEILYDAFRKMQIEYPNVKRYVNEYGIISRGGLNKDKQQWYYDYIKRIDEHTNNAIDGIGIQSHIGTDLTPPTRVLDLLDYYSTLGKTISISEFTLDIDDPLIRKMYTEDFMIAAFSHPNVNEFLFWGYEGRVDSKVDIITPDGDLGSMGQGFYNLVHGYWKTNIDTILDDNGKLEYSAYYGTYEYKFEWNGKPVVGIFNHKPGQKTVIDLQF